MTDCIEECSRRERITVQFKNQPDSRYHQADRTSLLEIHVIPFFGAERRLAKAVQGWCHRHRSNAVPTLGMSASASVAAAPG